jgi:hypothetical protein
MVNPPSERTEHLFPSPPISAAPIAPDPPAGVDSEPPLAHLPPPMVEWQQPAVSYQVPAGEPFAISLPALKPTPAGVPGEVMVDPLGDTPSWLIVDRELLQLSGIAPRTAKDQTYTLIFRAKAAQGGRRSIASRFNNSRIDQSFSPTTSPTTTKCIWINVTTSGSAC